MRDDERRVAFADFLRRVAGNHVGTKEWQRFAVTHYQDEFLEEIRRKTVRLSQSRDGGKEWSDSELAALQNWTRELSGGETV